MRLIYLLWGSPENRFSHDGKVVRKEGIITDGPYAEMKESEINYCVIKADSAEEASELLKDCPVFLMEGTVEIRERIAS